MYIPIINILPRILLFILIFIIFAFSNRHETQTHTHTYDKIEDTEIHKIHLPFYDILGDDIGQIN